MSRTHTPNQRTAPRHRHPIRNENNPFRLPPQMQNENTAYHANNQYGYQQSHPAVPNAWSGRSKQKSGRSRGRRAPTIGMSNNNASSSVFIPSEQSLQERFRNERIASHIEETLGPILKFTEFPKDFLINVLLPCIPSEKAGILVAGVLLSAAKEKGTDEIGKLWKESQLRWVDLFGTYSTTVDNFIKKNELEFTIKPYEKRITYELKGLDRTAEEIEYATKLVISQFLLHDNIQETVMCVIELASPRTVHMFINTAINEVLKQSNNGRCHNKKPVSPSLLTLHTFKARSLGRLFAKMQKQHLVTFEQFKKGFCSLLESVDNYPLDIPLFWNCMGEIIEPMTEDQKLHVFLRELFQPCIPSEAAGLLVSAVLRCSASKKGNVITQNLWEASGLQWTEFLGADSNIEKFVQNQKLEFLVIPKTVEAHMTSPNVFEKTMSFQRSTLPLRSTLFPGSIEDIKQNLSKLLQGYSGNEILYNFIDMRPQSFRTTESVFIRALVLAVHEKAISGANCELSKANLNDRIPLLKHYISRDEHSELQALYALQSLMQRLRHPSGLLQQIFEILYDAGVIKKETFRTWEYSLDPEEYEGKIAAVTTVNIFLKRLEEESRGGKKQSADNESKCCVS